MSQLTDSSSLIGKDVAYTNELGEEQSGTVESVRFENGTVVLQVGEQSVPLSAILQVTAAAGDPDPADPSDTNEGFDDTSSDPDASEA